MIQDPGFSPLFPFLVIGASVPTNDVIDVYIVFFRYVRLETESSQVVEMIQDPGFSPLFPFLVIGASVPTNDVIDVYIVFFRYVRLETESSQVVEMIQDPGFSPLFPFFCSSVPIQSTSVNGMKYSRILKSSFGSWRRRTMFLFCSSVPIQSTSVNGMKYSRILKSSFGSWRRRTMFLFLLIGTDTIHFGEWNEIQSYFEIFVWFMEATNDVVDASKQNHCKSLMNNKDNIIKIT